MHGPPTTPAHWVSRLANLIHTIRPDWDEAGVRAALAKVMDRPLIDVATAALAATHRTDQYTPAIIAKPGAHWSTTKHTPEPARDPCAICGIPRTAHNLAGHEWISQAEEDARRARIKAENVNRGIIDRYAWATGQPQRAPNPEPPPTDQPTQPVEVPDGFTSIHPILPPTTTKARS